MKLLEASEFFSEGLAGLCVHSWSSSRLIFFRAISVFFFHCEEKMQHQIIFLTEKA